MTIKASTSSVQYNCRILFLFWYLFSIDCRIIVLCSLFVVGTWFSLNGIITFAYWGGESTWLMSHLWCYEIPECDHFCACVVCVCDFASFNNVGQWTSGAPQQIIDFNPAANFHSLLLMNCFAWRSSLPARTSRYGWTVAHSLCSNSKVPFSLQSFCKFP